MKSDQSRDSIRTKEKVGWQATKGRDISTKHQGVTRTYHISVSVLVLQVGPYIIVIVILCCICFLCAICDKSLLLIPVRLSIQEDECLLQRLCALAEYPATPDHMISEVHYKGPLTGDSTLTQVTSGYVSDILEQELRSFLLATWSPT